MAEGTAPKQRKSIGRPFPKGVSGNPAGRPKGASIKELVKAHLDTHPEDREEFVIHFIKSNRELAWQMLEGRPAQDVTSAGEKINPVPIYGGQSVQDTRHNSDKEDIFS